MNLGRLLRSGFVWSSHVFLLGIFLPAVGAQEVVIPTDNPRGGCYNLEQLSRMSWCELEQIYRQAKVGGIPDGYCTGRVIYGPDKLFPALASKMAGFWWRGKYCDPACGESINHWLIGKAVRAKVYIAPSRFDGQPAIIMDYAGSCWFRWRHVRDEMREVAPGLYLGAMFFHNQPCAPPKMFFAVELEGDR